MTRTILVQFQGGKIVVDCWIIKNMIAVLVKTTGFMKNVIAQNCIAQIQCSKIIFHIFIEKKTHFHNFNLTIRIQRFQSRKLPISFASMGRARPYQIDGS